MSVFLARLADDLGFDQEWERLRRVDYTWYIRGSKHVAAVIEHENDSTDCSTELARLASSAAKLNPAPLSVLMTYYGDKFDREQNELDRIRIVKHVREGLAELGGTRTEFLLVIGPEDWGRGSRWYGFRAGAQSSRLAKL